MTAAPTLSPDRYLQCIRADGELLASIAEQGLDAVVESCPGWTVRDVVLHTATVYQHKIACLRLGAAPDPWPPDFGDVEAVSFLRSSLAELLTELADRDPTSPTYTWYKPDRTVGFWYRRMAQETAVHRVDVQSGRGQVTPVDRDLAVDGVDEVLDWFLRYGYEEYGEEPGGSGQRVAIRTGDRSWLVRLEAAAIGLDRSADGAADATVGGDPSDVLLWLWGRLPESAVIVDGDREAVQLLRRLLVEATQ